MALRAPSITTCTQLVVQTPCKRKNRSSLRGGGGGGGGAQGRAGRQADREGRPAGRSWFMALLATPYPFILRIPLSQREIDACTCPHTAGRRYKRMQVWASTTRSSRGRGLGEVINACIVTHVARERVEA